MNDPADILLVDPEADGADAGDDVSLAVVIVDDHPDRRAGLSAMARRLGWRVEALDSAALVAHAPFGRRIDAVILGGATPESVIARSAALFETDADGERDPALARVGPAETASAGGVANEVVTVAALFDAVNRAVVARGGGLDKVARASSFAAAGLHLLPGAQVLVVDDSGVNRVVAQRILEREGAAVVTCGNGAEALSCLRERRQGFDVVLMDVQMPVMDGNEATRRLRAEPGLEALPVIALTAGALSTERQRAIDSGMNDFISKPLDPANLIRRVRHHVESARGAPLSVAARVGERRAVPAEWPHIDRIDGGDAAQRLDNDLALFLSMLGRLVREYEGFEVPPRADLQEEPLRRALGARMHALRGSAGMLGAKPLQKLAGEAEAACKRGAAADGLLPILARVAERLAALSTQARPLPQTRSEDCATTTESAAAAPADPAAVGELARLLLDQHLSALDRFAEMRESLRVVLGVDRLGQLRDALEGLEFTRAAALLSSVEANSAELSEQGGVLPV